ncbi:MAG: EFR1 family ferrodoxin [Termitinemataceae bacterium]|nr:MAG: EFR1 family ferrodoxin [Termitinemataceae bacterium]
MSDNIIFYFSGTGNSLHTAKLIAEKIGDCDIVNMAQYCGKNGNSGFTLDVKKSKIGFVFPCYACGLPNIVKRFIISLELPSIREAYFFAVATCGATAGNSLSQVKDLLSSKRLDITYGATVKMFSNCIALYKMADNAEGQAIESDKEIQKIAIEILNGARNDIPKSRGIINIVSNIAGKTFTKNSKKYYVSNVCNACGKCVKLCPTGNITLETGRPVFGAQCEQCMACIQWCPELAINYKSKTEGARRYHHPNVSLDEMIV